eukprot:4293521-Pyramimonas_sp.AAC.1
MLQISSDASVAAQLLLQVVLDGSQLRAAASLRSRRQLSSSLAWAVVSPSPVPSTQSHVQWLP